MTVEEKGNENGDGKEKEEEGEEQVDKLISSDFKSAPSWCKNFGHKAKQDLISTAIRRLNIVHLKQINLYY